MGKRGPLPSHARIRALPGREERRPPPPEGLTDAQAALWRAITETEPGHLFDSEARRHLLRVYCEHAVFRADLQGLIGRIAIEKMLGANTHAGLEQLLRARDRETKALVSLATRLRLTNQSRYTPSAAGTAGRNETTAPSLPDDPASDYFPA